MRFILCILMVLVAAMAGHCADFRAQELTVGEFFSNPLGRDLSELSFSWKLPDLRRGMAQKAYQIQVLKDGKFVWDSGRVESAQNVKVPYGGRSLDSAEKFYWRVRFWDESKAASEWSDWNSFETGLVSNSDWKGKWISTAAPIRDLYSFDYRGKPKNRSGVPPTYIRKTFLSAKKVKEARLYVASRGIFEIRLNGDRVGDTLWGTGWTSYGKRVVSDTFDVTNLVKNGRNVLSAVIADGWFAGRIVNRYGNSPKPQLLAQLEIVHTDGTRATVVTDSTWKTSFGAYLYSDIFDGESVDASLEPEGWTKPIFDDSSWSAAAVSDVGETPLITPRRNHPVRLCEKLAPVSVKEISEGVFIFDFGQNMAGVPRLKLKGEKGKTVKIRYAEMLNKDGTMYTENYRTAISTDFYKPAADGNFVYQPVFTFHGYRYVEASGLARGWKPSLAAAVSFAMHNDMPVTGNFSCSHPKINRLQSNILWGQRGNYLSVPTDCPQRDERMGWTGDAQVFIATGAFNMDVDAFFSKWNLDMRDTQRADGGMPDMVPQAWGGISPAWGDACTVCPWEIYLAYADKKALSENFEMMKKWVDFQKKGSKNLVRPDEGYGDWLQPSTTRSKDFKLWRGNTPRPLIGTAYFARCADIVSKAAKILGRAEDSKEYGDLAVEIRSAFVREFVSSDGSVKGDCQTAYLLPLAFDLLPPELAKKSFGKFLEVLERDKFRLDTGLVGTPILNPVLSKFGRTDLAYRIINGEEYPSWIYSINQGATTMWERWNSYSHEKGFGEASMNSFNHYAYGAIGEWLYRTVAGIWHDEDAPGYANIIFAPKPGGGLSYASASIETPNGRASSSWKIENYALVWDVLVPPNSTGTLVFPTDDFSKITVNGKVPQENNMKVVSGKWKIIVKSWSGEK